MNKMYRNLGCIMIAACFLMGCSGEADVPEVDQVQSDGGTPLEIPYGGESQSNLSGDDGESNADTNEGTNGTGAMDSSTEEQVQELIASMTVEEKVAQLFIVTPESIVEGISIVTAAGEKTQAAINEYPVGGFIYMSQNLENEEQVQTMLENTNAYSMERIGLPAFLSVDEEGGTVARIGSNSAFDVETVPDMSDVGATNDPDEALKWGLVLGEYLSNLGFNLDFAPVADVLTNSENTVVKYRSFGSDSDLVIEMSAQIAAGLNSYGILETYKHFPGHGSTSGDTHDGYAYTEKTLEELMECELLPFQAAIDNDCSFIMVGHISAPNVTGDDTPSSLSEIMVTDVLRGEMGYDGIVITDAMNMGAITEQYTSSEAAVKAILAGVDIILMPASFTSAYEGVIEAVESGVITEERLNESLERILRVKLEM